MAGSKIRGITIELSADATGLLDSVKGINSELKSTSTQLKDVDRLLKLDPTNTTLLTQKHQLLQEQIGNCKDKLDLLKQAQQDMDANGIDKNSEQYQALQREIIATEQELKNLKETAGSGSETLAKISAVTGQAGEKMENTGKKLLPVTAGIVALGTAAVTTAADFESSMSQVQATMGITSDAMSEVDGVSVNTMDTLSALAKQMGAETAFSASECAEALNYLALAGYDTQEMVDTLPTVLNLAAAGGVDLATASDMVTDAMSALGLETSDAEMMVDQMAKTASSTNTSVGQLGEGMLKIGGTAKNLKGGTAELATALGILANNGIKGAEGGTHLRNVILSLQNPTDTAAAFMEDLGIQVYDSEGNMRSLNDVLGDLQNKLDGLPQEERDNIISSIFNKTDLAAVNALLDNTGESWNNLQSSITDSAGAAQQMADTQLDNLQGQLTILKSAIEGLAISFGEILVPVISKVVDAVQSVVDWLNSLDEGTKETIVTIAAIAAAIGPLLVVGGKVLKGISSITGALSAMGTSAAGPIGLVVAGVAALVAGTIALTNALSDAYKEASPFTEALEDMKQKNSDLTDSINNTRSAYENSASAADAQAAVAQGLYDHLQDLIAAYDGTAGAQAEIQGTIDELNKVVPELGLSWDSVTNSLSKSNDEIYTNIEAMRAQAQVAALQEMYTQSLKDQYEAQRNLTDATNTAKGVLERYGLSYQDVIEFQKGGVLSTVDWYTKLGEAGVAIWDLGNATNEVTEAINNMAQAEDNNKTAADNVAFAETELGEAMRTAAQATKSAASEIEKACEEAFGGTIPEQLQTAINAAQAAGVQIPQELINGIRDGSVSVEQAAEELAKLTNAETQAKAEAQATANAYTDTMATEIESGAGDIEEAADNVVDELDKSEEAYDYGEDTGSSFDEGLGSQESNIASTASDIAQNVNDAMSTLPSDMNTAGSESGSNLDSGFGGWKGTVSGTVDEMYNFFYNTLGTTFASQMNTWGYNAGQKLNSGINLWSGDISTTATNLAQNAYNALGVLPGWMEAAGYQAGAGLYNGLNAWSSALYNLAWSMASSINAAARAALQIHSPSQVMEDTGLFTGKGWKGGLEKSRKGIMSTIESITTGVVDAFGNVRLGDGLNAMNARMNASVQGTGSAAGNATLETALTSMLGILSQYMPYLAADKDIRFDDGTWAGKLAPAINDELETISARKAMG